MSARLTRAIDFGSACAAALGVPTCAGGLGLVPGTSDGQADTRGNGVALGYNFGLEVEPRPGTQVAIAYRSQMEAPPGGKQILPCRPAPGGSFPQAARRLP